MKKLAIVLVEGTVIATLSARNFSGIENITVKIALQIVSPGLDLFQAKALLCERNLTFLHQKQ